MEGRARSAIRLAAASAGRIGRLRTAPFALVIVPLVATLALAACQPTVAPPSPSGSVAGPSEAVESAVPSAKSESPVPHGTGRVAGPASARAGLPDPRLTPGASNPDVTQANIGATVCRTGWSKSVRPPVSYTGTLKRRQILEYGYADRDPAHYQEDHLIPLSLGGAPRDPRNLWPQPLVAHRPDGTDVGAATKDGFELYLHDALCRGSTSLAAAQKAMATDWVAAWEAAGRP